MSNLTTAIKNAASLDELLDVLRAHDTRDADLSDLPTFGGEEPSDTMGIFSWDEGRLLIGEGGWKLVSRAEHAGFTVDDLVEAGAEGTDDHDTGTVVEISGANVTVAWDSGVRTTQHHSRLRLV